MKNQLKADLAMLVVTVFWGSSYLLMKMGLTGMNPFNLIAMRFSLAFILAGTLFYKRLLSSNRRTIGYGIILGFILFCVFVAVTYGVQFTTTSHAGFLVSLAVVFVPILISALTQSKPQPKIIISICMAVIGVGLLTLNGHFKFNIGDILCISGAFFYAVYIVVMDMASQKADAATVGTIQLGFAGLLGLVFSLFGGGPQLPSTPKSWVAVLALSVLCSAFGFIVQAVAQKYTTPTHIGLIFSMEPVFTVIFAYIFESEALSQRGLLGASLVLFSVLIAEFGRKKQMEVKPEMTPANHRHPSLKND